MSSGFFRRAGLRIAGGLLVLTLLVTGGALMVRYVIAEPASIKSIVDKSGIYDHLIEATLTELPNNIIKDRDKLADLPLTDPVIKEPLKEAFTPALLRTNGENLIDGTYRWLDGTVPQPDFALDFSGANDMFLQASGERLNERLSGLPACSATQLQALAAVDAFKTTCVPPGAPIEQLVEQAKSTLRSDENLLPDPKITADTFKKSGETQNIFASASGAPEGFRLLKQLPWVFLGLAGLLMLAIIFLSTSRFAGLEKIGKLMTISAVITLLIGLGLALTPSALFNQEALHKNQFANQVIAPLITQFAQSAGKVYLIFGFIILTIGSALWFGIRRGRARGAIGGSPKTSN